MTPRRRNERRFPPEVFEDRAEAEVWRRVRDGLAERDRLAVAVVEARKEAGKWRDADLARAEQAERLFTDAANERDRLAAELATARRLLDRARTALRFHRVLDHKDTMQLVADIDVEYRERGPAKER